ncbi:MAG: CHASE2 domain-containing protein [Limnothrix sp.]
MANFAQRLWHDSQQWRQNNLRLFVTAGSVTAGVLLLRALSLLQVFELSAFDTLIRLRPTEKTDDRIVIVAIDQKDINQYQWQLSDQLLADLLAKIDEQDPAAIGLDIVRDRPIGSGTADFQAAIASMPYFVGIEALHAESEFYTKPLDVMWKLDANGEKKDGVGFNNFILDVDGVVRRNILYWGFEGTTRRSFALQLAQVYLSSKQNILPQGYPSEAPKYLQLGEEVFYDLRDSHSLYGWLDPEENNYQIISNMRDPKKFERVSLSAVMTGEIPDDVFRNRVVLIGSVAENTKDLFLSPFSDKFRDEPGRIGGVEIHANFTSEMLSATLDGRPLLKTFRSWQDTVWILLGATLGSTIVWRWRSPRAEITALTLCTIVILGSTYSLFTIGWIFPVVPSLLSLFGAASLIATHTIHQDRELSRSREFFHLIIDNIPDPVFVKDTEFKLTVVNDAFCQLLGGEDETMIGKSDYDIFAKTEAAVFRQQELSVLQTSKAQENEEILTNFDGNTFNVATKRSLHKDGAGNIFLVGVIRDITERKKLEADLRRTAAELTRSNDELKKSEENLRHLANHDPLTELPNRKYFNETLQKFVHTRKENGKLLSLLFLDLDGFKPVNDNLGHDIGDVLLKAVAQRIKNRLRTTDVVSRLGGDEFTVLLPDIKEPLDSIIVAKKILSALSDPYMLQGKRVSVTASIGVSVYPLDATETSELIRLADQAMYEAKRSGRNQYSLAPELAKSAVQVPQI